MDLTSDQDDEVWGELLSLRDASLALKVSTELLNQWMDEGSLHYIRRGSQRLILARSLSEFVEVF